MKDERCGKGYFLWLQKCTDIDECDQKINWCGNLACENSVGGFSCHCPEGSESYESFNVDYQKIETKCRDIDECLSNNTCPKTARCQNKVGGYNCLCNKGFQGLESKTDNPELDCHVRYFDS